MSVNTLLGARGETHGRFSDNARVGQHLRAFWRSQSSWAAMPEVQREALDHMAGKLSRIFSGQATFCDHWADIAGYAALAQAACPEPPVVSLSSGVMGPDGQWHPRCDA